MLFRRKKEKKIKHKIRDFFWPQNGWERYGKYILLRLSRLKGSPHSIAIGFACGAAISFTPLIGLHMSLAALTALIFGGNVLASAIGTLVGNPWSFPLIWISTLKLGQWFLGLKNEHYDGFVALFADAMKALLDWDLAKFGLEIWPILKPMLVGSIPFYVIAFASSYWLIRFLIEKVLKAREKRKKKRLAKLMNMDKL